MRRIAYCCAVCYGSSMNTKGLSKVGYFLRIIGTVLGLTFLLTALQGAMSSQTFAASRGVTRRPSLSPGMMIRSQGGIELAPRVPRSTDSNLGENFVPHDSFSFGIFVGVLGLHHFFNGYLRNSSERALGNLGSQSEHEILARSFVRKRFLTLLSRNILETMRLRSVAETSTEGEFLVALAQELENLGKFDNEKASNLNNLNYLIESKVEGPLAVISKRFLEDHYTSSAAQVVEMKRRLPTEMGHDFLWSALLGAFDEFTNRNTWSRIYNDLNVFLKATGANNVESRRSLNRELLLSTLSNELDLIRDAILENREAISSLTNSKLYQVQLAREEEGMIESALKFKQDIRNEISFLTRKRDNFTCQKALVLGILPRQSSLSPVADSDGGFEILNPESDWGG